MGGVHSDSSGNSDSRQLIRAKVVMETDYVLCGQFRPIIDQLGSDGSAALSLMLGVVGRGFEQ